MPRNLGKSLERRINKANYKYRKDGVAMIKKEETPIRITKGSLVATLGTVDYGGAVLVNVNDLEVGLCITFDAKECKSKTSFPLSNIHQHQLEFLKFHDSIGSCAFFLIQFTKHHLDEVFMTPISFVSEAWSKAQEGGKKSIKYENFNKSWLINIDNYLTKIIKSQWKGSLEKMLK